MTATWNSLLPTSSGSAAENSPRVTGLNGVWLTSTWMRASGSLDDGRTANVVTVLATVTVYAVTSGWNAGARVPAETSSHSSDESELRRVRIRLDRTQVGPEVVDARAVPLVEIRRLPAHHAGIDGRRGGGRDHDFRHCRRQRAEERIAGQRCRPVEPRSRVRPDQVGADRREIAGHVGRGERHWYCSRRSNCRAPATRRARRRCRCPCCRRWWHGATSAMASTSVAMAPPASVVERLPANVEFSISGRRRTAARRRPCRW